MCRLFIISLLTTLLGIQQKVQAYGYNVYDMDSSCGGGIFISNFGAVIIQLTSDSTYRPNMNCTFSFATGAGRRIVAKFRKLDIESSQDCRYDKLELYDGDSIRSPRLTGFNGLCGHKKPRQTYVTTQKSLTLKFTSDDNNQYKGFSVYLTDFRPAPCFSSEYWCDNGRCIDGYLKCDGWNNCGDDSDEYVGCGWHHHFRTRVIISASVGGFFALGLCLAVVTVLVRRICSSRRKSYQKMAEDTS